MQDRCAHLFLTLQQSPLFVESDVFSVYVSEGVVVVDLLEQEECQLSASDLSSQ